MAMLWNGKGVNIRGNSKYLKRYLKTCTSYYLLDVRVVSFLFPVTKWSDLTFMSFLEELEGVNIRGIFMSSPCGRTEIFDFEVGQEGK
jgi:hypothetical protein